MSLIVVVYAMVNLSMMPRRTPKVMMPRMIQTTTKWPEQQSRPLSPSATKKSGGKFESEVFPFDVLELIANGFGLLLRGADFDLNCCSWKS